MFFLLYTFIIRPILENEKNNKAVRFYLKISDEILNSDAAKVNEVIWNIIVNLKEDPFKFKDENNGFEKMFPISHLFEPFNKNPSFCFHYILEERCYLCNTIKKIQNIQKL